MKKLIEGFLRYKAEVYPEQRELFRELAVQQSPDTLFIACSDSRVVPSAMLQAGPGELFVCRNAGNIAPSYEDDEHAGGVSAAIEYAVQVLRVSHIVVCGHSDCGAMTAALDPQRVAHLPAVAQWLRHADRAVAVTNEKLGTADASRKLECLIEENVRIQLRNLTTHPSVAAQVQAGRLQLHGWVYDIPNCDLKAYDPDLDRFAPMTSAVETMP